MHWIHSSIKEERKKVEKLYLDNISYQGMQYQSKEMFNPICTFFFQVTITKTISFFSSFSFLLIAHSLTTDSTVGVWGGGGEGHGELKLRVNVKLRCDFIFIKRIVMQNIYSLVCTNFAKSCSVCFCTADEEIHWLLQDIIEVYFIISPVFFLEVYERLSHW